MKPNNPLDIYNELHNNYDPNWTTPRDTTIYNKEQGTSTIDGIRDADWITDSYASGFTRVHPAVQRNLLSSVADGMFVDSSLGGNYSLNPQPQYTPYSDPRRSLLQDPNGSLDYDETSGLVMGKTGFMNAISPAVYNTEYPAYTGAGRIWAETIENPKQTIRLTFGVPKFNSVIAFWSSFMNTDVEILARTGVYPNVLIKGAGITIGAILMTAVMAEVSIILWIGKWVGGLLFGSGGGSYYRLEPTPHTYIASMNSAINHLATQLGIYPDLTTEQNKKDPPTNTNEVKARQNNTSQTRAEIELLSKLAPNLFTKDYGIDMFAVMGKTESIRIAVNKALAEKRSELKKGEAARLAFNIARKAYIRKSGMVCINPSKESTKYDTLYDVVRNTPDKYAEANYVQSKLDAKAAASSGGSTSTPSSSNNESQEGGANDASTHEAVAVEASKLDNFSSDITTKGKKPTPDNGETSNAIEDILDKSVVDTYAKWLKVFMEKGALYTTIDVDYTGPVSETFSNSVTDIESGAAFNSASASARGTRYNLAGGNILGGAIGDTIESLVSGAAAVMMSAADFMTAGLSSTVSALFRAAEIDMPKRYASSDVTLSGSSYSFTLKASAGSTYSQLTQIWIPLISLIVGAAQRKVGPNARTSPLLCSLDDKGKRIIDKGIISKLTITRGEGNIGFTDDMNTISVKVDLEILDMAPIISVPISTGGFFNTLGNRRIELDGPWADYINTIAATTIAERTFVSSRIRLSKTLAVRNYQSATSKAAISHSIMDSGPGRLITNIFGDFDESKH